MEISVEQRSILGSISNEVASATRSEAIDASKDAYKELTSIGLDRISRLARLKYFDDEAIKILLDKRDKMTESINAGNPDGITREEVIKMEEEVSKREDEILDSEEPGYSAKYNEKIAYLQKMFWRAGQVEMP